MSNVSSEHQRRFAGIEQLYGEQGYAQITNSHICVIGVGGVGSWVVESLARSAVGKITMIDMDIVANSNINRQILATTDTVGRDKVAVLVDRISQINPDCEAAAIDDFIKTDNLSKYISPSFDFVIDCIDDFRVKAALINYCKQHAIKILTVGGAGGQSNPSKIRLTDLSSTQHDVLLATTRKRLRQKHGFARNLKKSFSVPCVYSDEQSVYADGQGGLSSQKPFNGINTETSSSALSCAGDLGSISHVTATFAMFATGYVLNELANVS